MLNFCYVVCNQPFHSSCKSFKLDNFSFMLSKPYLSDHFSKDYKVNEMSHIPH